MTFGQETERSILTTPEPARGTMVLKRLY